MNNKIRESDLAYLLEFAALNYTPKVGNNGRDILWFEDKSVGYTSEEVVDYWLGQHSELSKKDSMNYDFTPNQKMSPIKLSIDQIALITLDEYSSYLFTGDKKIEIIEGYYVFDKDSLFDLLTTTAHRFLNQKEIPEMETIKSSHPIIVDGHTFDRDCDTAITANYIRSLSNKKDKNGLDVFYHHPGVNDDVSLEGNEPFTPAQMGGEFYTAYKNINNS